MNPRLIHTEISGLIFPVYYWKDFPAIFLILWKEHINQMNCIFISSKNDLKNSA